MTRRPDSKSVHDDLAAIIWTAQELGAVNILFWPRYDEWTRGGNPSASISAGRGLAEPPLPMPDAVDRQLALAATRLAKTCQDVRRDLDALLASTTAWVAVAPRIAEPEPAWCAHCDGQVTGVGSDRFRTSPLDSTAKVCPRCATHERRHGRRWPQTRALDNT